MKAEKNHETVLVASWKRSDNIRVLVKIWSLSHCCYRCRHRGNIWARCHLVPKSGPLGLRGGTNRSGEPQLELHTLNLRDYAAQGDSDPKAPVTEGCHCCHQEMYIDLQGMKWAEIWVLEPPDFLAYECVSTCQQLLEVLTFKCLFLGPGQCMVLKTALLPMIICIKEGGRTRPQVVSLPNMRVRKCSCALDGDLVPRKLQYRHLV
ncbi:Left-right determination factor 2 [Saguinus oedipus]|uniref:Left-right determination factor 2 n=1 Tax=Saguinus oedipus TaxID=9490 RepID=A0ABQ9UHG6_SAGOE|nr:Left-right determination factor 2 [Saguinus oedipus]